MYCGKCGKQVPDGASFCAYCGNPTQNNQSLQNANNKTQMNSKLSAVWEKMNDVAVIFVPRSWVAKFSFIPPLAFALSYILVAVIVITSTCGIVKALGHDLEGTYRTSEFFPVNSITFYKNGEFIAYTSSGDTLYGEYDKGLNGEYSLEFTDGKSNGGSAVTQYVVSASGDLYSLAAEKISDNQLDITVIPGISYYAWIGTVESFYKY